MKYSISRFRRGARGAAPETSPPGKGTVRHRMQPAFDVARKAKRRQQRRFFTQQLCGDQLWDADHLKAVVESAIQ